MGTYNVKVNGFDLKVRVVEHAEMISQGISELRDEINKLETIVGVNIFCPNGSYKFPLVQLCVGNRCLVIVSRYVNLLETCLKDFLEDPNICFVGVKMDLGSSNELRTPNIYAHEFAIGMDVRELAARALKKLNLWHGQLNEVCTEVGIHLDDCEDVQVLEGLSSSDRVFSQEQIECLARYPHATYLIGKKILRVASPKSIRGSYGFVKLCYAIFCLVLSFIRK